MSVYDFVQLACQSLKQHRLRTVLTVLGVIVGAALLVGSLMAGHSVKIAITTMFDAEQLRRIYVHLDYGNSDESETDDIEIKGKMSEERRERLKKAAIREAPVSDFQPKNKLTKTTLKEIESLPHVHKALPEVRQWWQVIFGEKVRNGVSIGVDVDGDFVSQCVLAGSLNPDAKRHVLIHEHLAYQWGAVNEVDNAKLVGKKLKLEKRSSRNRVAQLVNRFSRSDEDQLTATDLKLLDQLSERFPKIVGKLDVPKPIKQILAQALSKSDDDEPDINISETFTISGMFRTPTEDEVSQFPFGYTYRNVKLVLPIRDAIELHERHPNRKKFGFDEIVVTVDRKEHVREVMDQIEKLGFRTHSLVSWV